jgi:predicted transcriptional regulator
LNQGKLAERRLSLAGSKKFLQEIAMNYEEGQIFQTAIELGIFTKLMEPKSAENIAEELGTDSRLTARILDVLVSLEVLKKREKTYTTSPMLASFLLEGSSTLSRSLSISHEEASWVKNNDLFKENTAQEL